ncbi:MAG: hypothetical protein V4665_00775 [Patescibacteria group bacterium]
MNHSSKNTVQKAFRVFLYGFAIVGFIFTAVFFGIRFGWLNVKGSVSERNLYFNFTKSSPQAGEADDLAVNCRINVLGKYAPLTAINIYRALSRGTDEKILTQMIDAAAFRFADDSAFRATMQRCGENTTERLALPVSAFYWADTDEWNLMRDVFSRDQDIIKKAAADAGISPRLLLGGVIGEQFRFLNSRREAFKSYFEPLKILASLSNTSFGIAGLKPKTVEQIEGHLKDRTSPFYPGAALEHAADYADPSLADTQRLDRITDAKNPYYSYLYVGLYMAEVISQWEKAGYDIGNRPDILATLYNLGFYYSQPKDNPQAGGTIIHINGRDYTFGDLAYEFYYSGELADAFPLGIQ